MGGLAKLAAVLSIGFGAISSGRLLAATASRSRRW
jgi:hypothetical protein